jgi:outer membrane receptor protein involved in Fe transport
MNDEAMVYLEIGNGYKAGGFDEDNGMGREVQTVGGVTDDLADFEDESVETVELGAKIDLADGRGRLNIAAYVSTYEDVQVSTFDGNAAFVVGNAAESEVQGIEADVLFRISEEITLNGAFAYLDATYKSFPGAGCNLAQSLVTPRGCTQDLSGKPLQFAPEYTANVGINYQTEMSSGMVLSAGLDYNWSDDVVIGADLDENLIQESFGKLNARIALTSDDQWQISLVGKNLTDEATFMWGNDIPLGPQGFNGSYFKLIDPPRSVEINARYNF